MNRSIRMLSVAAALVIGSGSIALAQGGSNTGASGFVNPGCMEQPGTTGTTGSLSGGTSGSGMSGGSMSGGSMSGGSAGMTGGSGTTMATGPTGSPGNTGNVSGNSARQTGGC